MKSFIDHVRPAIASYLALVVYIVARECSFAGDWVLSTLAMFAVIHFRYSIYHTAREEKKTRFAALGVGYFVFFAFAMLLLPWAVRLPISWQPTAMWLIPRFDLFYLVPAATYMIMLDRQKEPQRVAGGH